MGLLNKRFTFYSTPHSITHITPWVCTHLLLPLPSWELAPPSSPAPQSTYVKSTLASTAAAVSLWGPTPSSVTVQLTTQAPSASPTSSSQAPPHPPPACVPPTLVSMAAPAETWVPPSSVSVPPLTTETSASSPTPL